MLVADLQALIGNISADIVRQKKVLGDLQRRKSAAQRQLNAVRDPMARLPLEISSEIFVQCLPEAQQPVDAHRAPFLFLNVCTMWSDIALATPRLWISIDVNGRYSNLASLLDAWTQRAGSLALSVSLPHGLTHGISAVVKRNAHRLHDLKMFCDNTDIALMTDAGPFTSLTTLTLFGSIDEEQFTCSTRATMAILYACPNLVECTFHGVWSTDTDDANILVLPRLRVINFGTSPDESSDYILKYLTLPSLCSLFTPLIGIAPRALIQFLKRSSPPLERVSIRETWVRLSTNGMDECLGLLPRLTHFELIDLTTGSADHFLAILTNSPHLLPDLSTVIFRRFRPPQPWYQKLCGALVARREHLRSIQVLWIQDEPRLSPPEDVAGQLRQLVADGMAIHIGPEEHNYI